MGYPATGYRSGSAKYGGGGFQKPLPNNPLSPSPASRQ